MKKLALFLVLVFVFTGITPALAAEDISQLVLSVKNRVPIDEVCTEFNGSPYTRDGKTVYHLDWYTPDGAENYKSISVAVDQNYVITSYSEYSRSIKYNKVLPKITKEQALEAAKAFFAKANPDIAAVYDFDKAEVNYSICEYYITVQRYENGLPVYGNTASFTVGGENGIVRGMNTSYTPYLVFADYSSALATDGAKAAFEALGGLELVYRSFETEGKAPVARPIYVSSGNALRIDALTGAEYSDKEYADSAYRETTKNQASLDSAAGGASLTPQEIAEIEKLAQLITYEDAETKIKAMPELLLSADATLSYSRVYKMAEDKYIMNISLEWEDGYADATLNAKTGEITSFYAYDNKAVPEQQYAADKGKAEAVAFAEKYMAEYVSSSTVDTGSVLDEADARYRQTWTRVQNGIEYEQNSISVTVDKQTLKVSRFNVNWSHDVTFESLDGIISSGEAYAKLFEHITPKLYYYINSAGTAANPVYITTFGEVSSIYAKDGTALDYMGEKCHKNEKINYTDILGHYAEKQITALLDIGVGFEGGQFMPDNIITQGEYITLLSDCVMDYYPITGGRADVNKIYNYAVSRGILSLGDVDEDAPLTREKAVTYLLRAMGYAEFAEIEGIFYCDFADAGDITPALYGYVSIARGLKIVSGAEGNMFMPQKQMTRAEAAVILYNYLSQG